MSLSCQALWRAVILQQLQDASGRSQKPENIVSRERAKIWLRCNTKDFETVAHFAGFDDLPLLRKKIAVALESGCVWRKPTSRQR